jgi:hypothetical protein
MFTALADMQELKTAQTVTLLLKQMNMIASTMVLFYSSVRIVRISITYDTA